MKAATPAHDLEDEALSVLREQTSSTVSGQGEHHLFRSNWEQHLLWFLIDPKQGRKVKR